MHHRNGGYAQGYNNGYSDGYRNGRYERSDYGSAAYYDRVEEMAYDTSIYYGRRLVNPRSRHTTTPGFGRASAFVTCSEAGAPYYLTLFTRISCMPLRGTKIGRVLRQRRDDAAIAWTFFRQWLKAPLTTAAVSPSSRELAAEMLSQLPEGAAKVIELGGGTGVFTEALLTRGIAPENLLVFELNESLHLHLTQRFPSTRIVCADALSTARVVEREKFAQPGEVDAIVSGLGLLSMSQELQHGILRGGIQRARAARSLHPVHLRADQSGEARCHA